MAAVAVAVPQRISRLVLDQLRTGPKTRRQLYDVLKDDIDSMTRLKNSLQYLHKNKRLVVYLPAGKKVGEASFLYKPNPHKERINFPLTSRKTTSRENALRRIVALGPEEPLFPEIAAKESAIADDGDVFFNKS